MNIATLATAAVLAIAAGGANALTFQGAFNVAANASDPGLVVQTDAAGPTSFDFGDLAVGEHSIIKLFTISTDESTVNNGEDTVAKPISVAFSFASPTASASIDGDTVGVRLFGGTIQFGKVTWDGPMQFGFGIGGLATLKLLDADFGKGVFGLSEKAGTVKAKLTYDVAPVPVPAAAGLLAAALAGLGLFGARRRAA